MNKPYTDDEPVLLKMPLPKFKLPSTIEQPTRPHKIAIFGDGNIGTELWKELTSKGAADQIVVHNRHKPGEPNKWDAEEFKGKMIAVDQANLIKNNHKHTSQFMFTNHVREALEGADIVIITAGPKRKNATQPRTELLGEATKALDPIAHLAKEVAPNATYIVATNPVDAMAQYFQEKSGLESNQVLGLGGELDRARMVQSISNQLQIPPEHIHNANVVGQHGETMLPLLSQVVIKAPGKEPRRLLDILEGQPEKLAEIRDASVKGGARLVARLKGSDYIAPAAALESMVDNVIAAKYQGQQTPVIYASALDRESGVYIGQPVQMDSNGRHQVLELPELSVSEREGWERSVKDSLNVLKDIPNFTPQGNAGKERSGRAA